MRRRNFITLLGGAAAWPLAARAQQTALPVVGFLGLSQPEAPIVAAFRRGLNERGYVEGQNVTVEYRWADGQFDQLPALAAELVRHRVAVIATPASVTATRAAKAATATIPVVFSMSGDPIQLGLVASLSRPGGNATGFAQMNSEIAPKRFELLHEFVPEATRFALLVEPNSTTTPPVIVNLQSVASAIGIPIEVFYAPGTDRDIDTAFATLAQKRINALLVAPSSLFYERRTQIAALAARHAIPAVYWDSAFAEVGGLVSYGSRVTDQFHQVGVYVGRILKGEKPADLPVQQATRFELIINLKTAKALGLTVPPNLLATADEVIE
jgi:putative tryptophan/tyrosine transport system substrate-binding protein